MASGLAWFGSVGFACEWPICPKLLHIAGLVIGFAWFGLVRLRWGPGLAWVGCLLGLLKIRILSRRLRYLVGLAWFAVEDLHSVKEASIFSWFGLVASGELASWILFRRTTAH